MVLESRPTDNPTALSNLYILAGHENSYWASPRDRTVLRRVGKMPQFGEKTPDFDIRLCVKGKRSLSHWWRDGQFRKRGASSAGLSVALHQQRVHRGPSLHETARKNYEQKVETQISSCCSACFSLLCSVDRATNMLSRGIIVKSAIKIHKNLWLY